MGKQEFADLLIDKAKGEKKPSLSLEDGSRLAVMGGGPSGSLFAYFLLDMAERIGLRLHVDIFEPRDFSLDGPAGCNMCAGIVSESLIQMLAVEGLNLPSDVVQRGMDSYMLHNDVGTARLETPHLEKRIGAVFRGAGPRGVRDNEWRSFDGFLLQRAVDKGARLIHKRVEGIARDNTGRIQLKVRQDEFPPYDFLAVATGVNTNALRLFKPIEQKFKQPELADTFVREYYLGKEIVESTFGHTIHFFMLDLPGLDFAAIVPKGNYVTVCILGENLSQELFEDFLSTPQVKECMPPGWTAKDFVCHCAPRINLTGAIHPYAERMVFVGDCGISRLYKDGIGASYRAAKAAATAVIFSGIGEQDLRQHFWHTSRRMENDNQIGKIIFFMVRLMKPYNFISRAMIRMVTDEQDKPIAQRRLSAITWDMFTGSSPYRIILTRFLHPAFWSRFMAYLMSSLINGRT